MGNMQQRVADTLHELIKCTRFAVALIIIIIITRLVTRHMSIGEAMNRRRGWSSLVVTQPSTGQQIWCVRCVSVCTALSGIYYSGPSW